MEKRIQSIDRAVNILNCFTEENPSLTLAQISQQLSLNINTTRGLVNTLIANGLISHNKQNNTYTLGLYFILKSNLIYATYNINGYIEVALPYMQAISERYSVLTSIQIVNQGNIFMVRTNQPSRAQFRISAELYSPLNYHCTSSGKQFLQYLPEDVFQDVVAQMSFTGMTENSITNKEALIEELKVQKTRIYSTEYDEQAIGISSISAPILFAKNKLFGTISVTAPTQIVRKHERNMAKDLLEAGRMIAGAIQILPEYL